MVYAKPILVSLIASAFCTWLWIKAAHKFNVMDVPGQRRLHRKAVPRAGGLAIMFAMLLVVVLFKKSEQNWALISGLLGISLVGFVDDLGLISSRTKFIGQVAVLALVAFLLPDLSFAYKFLFVIAGLISINFWNFMDGSNGMIASQALVGAGFFLLAYTSGSNLFLSLIAACLLGACAGFLPFNTGSARVFLGDAGSHLLGLVIIYLAFMGAVHKNQHSTYILLGATLPIWLDALLTLLYRAIKGRNIFKAHREHLYQWLIRTKLSHFQVMLLYCCLSVLAGLIVWIYGVNGFIASSIGFAIFYWMAKWRIYSKT